jgi:hypothetical protein
MAAIQTYYNYIKTKRISFDSILIVLLFDELLCLKPDTAGELE